MKLEKLEECFTICKVQNYSSVYVDTEYCFVQKTDEEKSLVCLTEDVPQNTLEREDGFMGFRIQGELDFSLVGILAKISSILAENRIPVFVISTFNTDYFFVKSEYYSLALMVLENQGYTIV